MRFTGVVERQIDVAGSGKGQRAQAVGQRAGSGDQGVGHAGTQARPAGRINPTVSAAAVVKAGWGDRSLAELPPSPPEPGPPIYETTVMMDAPPSRGSASPNAERQREVPPVTPIPVPTAAR